MPSFIAWSFAAAGAICALGPIIIHLLNRRRYRVVPWAAMDFLRQALQQQRRVLQIRDLILLALRTAAVLLFGLVLARPYWSDGQSIQDPTQPVHLILVLDNSLSMSYESLDGSLLDRAKQAARQRISELPSGSRCSVIAACGAPERLAAEPYESPAAAIESLARVHTVDRTFLPAGMLEEIKARVALAPHFAPRIVIFTDQQVLNWSSGDGSLFTNSAGPVHLVSVAPPEWENTWIADVRLQDGLADVETPATVLVEIAYKGNARRNVQVNLNLGDVSLGQKSVTLEPGQLGREVEFQCQFAGLSELPESNRPVHVTLRAAVTPDRLTADDERFLTIPIVASVPVVFIDQYGPETEDAAVGRLGETRHLRRLLAPRTSRADAPRQLVSIRHLSPAQATPEKLADARLVVVAGIADPAPLVPVLKPYVEQGGQLFIAAGAQFDPARWNDAAWQQGQGILPLPLSDQPLGQTPDEAAGDLNPFTLALHSLASEPYFQIAGVPAAELESLYGEPVFFKAVQLAEAIAANQEGAKPRILARYATAGNPAFLVSRHLGKGQVILCTTGVLSPWNTLPKTNAFLVFDRILRDMLEATLPKRNYASLESLALPLPANEQNIQVTLQRPHSERTEALDVSYISADTRGVVLSQLFARGEYKLRGIRSATVPEIPVWELALAVNGDPAESDLTAISNEAYETLAAAGERTTGFGGLQAAAPYYGAHRIWRWFLATVLVLLLAEMAVASPLGAAVFAASPPLANRQSMAPLVSTAKND